MEQQQEREEQLHLLLTENREQTRQEIRAILARHRALAGTLDADRPSDWGDQVTRQIDDEMDVALLEHKGEQLLRIERAIERLQRGSYGLCESCGLAIPVERLSALPATSLCVQCVERTELG